MEIDAGAGLAIEGRIRQRTRKHLGDLVEHLRDPLYRNAYALVVNAGLSSVLGVLYWILVARLYSPEEVGRSSAVIAAIVLLSGVAQLSLRAFLGRFIPVAGSSTRRLVTGAYLASTCVAVVVSSGFVVVMGAWGEDDVFSVIVGLPALAVSFVLVTVLWCLFSLQDAVLIGLRRSVWVAVANSVFGMAKIALVVVFPFAIGSLALAIVASWVIPMAVAVLAVNALVFRRLIPRHMAASHYSNALMQPGRIARFVAGDYLGSLFAIAYTLLLPVIVIAQASPTTSAHFYIVWVIASAVQLVPLQMVVSLVVETASDPSEFRRRARHLSLQIARILGPAAIGLIVAAPLVLGFFGPSYAEEGTGVLRLLVVALAPFTVNVLYFGYLRVQAETRGIAIGHGLLAVGILGLATLLLPPLGLAGVGVAYLISQLALAVIVVATTVRPVFRRRPVPGSP